MEADESFWEAEPRTIAQLVAALKDDTGWTKATIS
jgi:predicted transcriptional regulator